MSDLKSISNRTFRSSSISSTSSLSDTASTVATESTNEITNSHWMEKFPLLQACASSIRNLTSYLSTLNIRESLSAAYQFTLAKFYPSPQETQIHYGPSETLSLDGSASFPTSGSLRAGKEDRDRITTFLTTQISQVYNNRPEENINVSASVDVSAPPCDDGEESDHESVVSFEEPEFNHMLDSYDLSETDAELEGYVTEGHARAEAAIASIRDAGEGRPPAAPTEQQSPSAPPQTEVSSTTEKSSKSTASEAPSTRASLTALLNPTHDFLVDPILKILQKSLISFPSEAMMEHGSQGGPNYSDSYNVNSSYKLLPQYKPLPQSDSKQSNPKKPTTYLLELESTDKIFSFTLPGKSARSVSSSPIESRSKCTIEVFPMPSGSQNTPYVTSKGDIEYYRSLDETFKVTAFSTNYKVISSQESTLPLTAENLKKQGNAIFSKDLKTRQIANSSASSTANKEVWTTVPSIDKSATSSSAGSRFTHNSDNTLFSDTTSDLKSV